MEWPGTPAAAEAWPGTPAQSDAAWPGSPVETAAPEKPPPRRVGVMDVVKQAGTDIYNAVASIPMIPQHAGEASEAWQQGERTAENAGTIAGTSMLGGVKIGRGGNVPGKMQAPAGEPVGRLPAVAPIVPESQLDFGRAMGDASRSGHDVSAAAIAEVGPNPKVPPLPPGVATKGVPAKAMPEPAPAPAPASLSSAASIARPVGAAPLPPTYEQASAAIRSRITPAPKESTLPNVRDLVTEVVDDLNPVARAERKALGGDLAPTIDSPYQQMRLTRGSGGKVEQFLQHGTFDYGTLADRGGSFVDAVKPIRGAKENFKEYLVARRDLELEHRGIPTGIDSTASQVVAKGAPKEFKTAADKLYKYQDDVLEYAHQAGLIGADALVEMRAANRAYVPFYRLMDEGSGPHTSKGFQTGQPTSRIVGSERQVLDPLESVIRNTQTFIQKAENNRALQTLETFSNAHPDMKIMTPVKAQARPIEIQPAEIARMADDLGVPPEALSGAETFTIFRRSDRQLGPNEIEIFKDGKPHRYELDPEIARAVKGMDNIDMGNLFRMIGAPSRWLRAGVVLDPTYMARNFVRDQFSATMQSGNKYIPVYDFLSGLTQRVTHGEQFQAWLKSGGAQSSLMSLDRSSAAFQVASKYGRDMTLGGKVKNVLLTPIDVLRAMSQIVDEATRIGEFQRATKGAGDLATMQKAGMASRDVTTDFAKHGRAPAVRAMSQISEFMNAQTQGTAREAQQVWRKPVATLALGAGAITLPSIYLWFENHKDPRYQNAQRWEKDAYWLVMPSDPTADPWRIPKPFTFGMAFGSSAERLLDAFYDKKPKAFEDFATNLGKTMLPNYIPTIAKPFIEQFANKSLFTSRPLESRRLENLPPSERYTEQTPEIAKKTGKGIAAVVGETSLASPQMLQNYIRAWGGTLATNAVTGVDAGLKALGLTDAAPAPTKGLADIPVIRAFVSRYPSANAQPIQDFYEKNTEIEQRFNARREARRRGDEDTAATYEAQIGDRTSGIKRQLDAGHREVRRILNSREPDMTPDAKREAIRQQYLQMLENAQRGLKIIKDSDEALKKRVPTEYKGP